MRKKIIFTVVGLLISGIFVFLVARGLEGKWGDFREAFRDANYWFILPAVAVGLLGYLIKTLRWRIIMAPLAVIPLRRLFSAIMIGFMANCVLPGRAGEFIRAGVISLRTNVSASACFATIVLERIFDSLTVVLFMVYVLLAYPSLTGGEGKIPDKVLKGGYLFIGLVIAGFVVIVLLKFFPRRVLSVAGKVLVFLPQTLRDKALGMLESFGEGLQVLHSWRSMLALAALSIVHWVVMAGIIYVMAFSFGERVPMRYPQSYLVFVYTALVVAAPQAPAFIGTFWWAGRVAIADLHIVPKEFSVEATGTAYAALLWAVSVVPVIIVGLICLWAEGLTLGEVRRKGEEIEGKQHHAEKDGESS